MAGLESKKSKIIIIGLVFVLGIAIGSVIGFKFCQQTFVVVGPLGNSQYEAGEHVGTYAVARVIDGDTIEIGGGEKVRYIGMDAPEMALEGKPEECGAKKALEKNRELVLGKIVELRKDVNDRDKYGRLLRYVLVDGVFINTELVRLGLAKAATYPPDVKYQDEITTAQIEAQKNKAGLWAECWGK